MTKLPEYTDGCFELCRIKNEMAGDYPVETLKKQDYTSVTEKFPYLTSCDMNLIREEKKITAKIRIPQYKKIDSRCVCLIDGEQHLVYNAAHITSKEGFPETELTLIRPEREIEIL